MVSTKAFVDFLESKGGLCRAQALKERESEGPLVKISVKKGVTGSVVSEELCFSRVTG